MNRPIVRLYGLVVLLFALLVAFTSRWTIFEASSLRSNPLNARGLLEQERIARGRILADDGTVLARSVRGGEGTYERRYPKGGEFAHPLGYSYTDLVQLKVIKRLLDAGLSLQSARRAIDCLRSSGEDVAAANLVIDEGHTVLARTGEEITRAREDWAAGRFPEVPGYPGHPLAAPALPAVPLRPR